MNFSKNSIKRFLKLSFTQNLSLKLVALCIAIVLVTVVRFQEKVERGVDMEVSVKLPDQAAGVVVASELPKTVRVLLRGRPSLLKNDKINDCHLSMDLSEKNDKGSFTYFFDQSMIEGLPSGVEVAQVTPETILIRVENLISKRLPVRVKMAGNLLYGTQLHEAPDVTPEEITVSGPSSLVRSLINVETDTVDLEGRGVGVYNVEVPLKPIEGVLNSHNDNTFVHFEVELIPGQRTIPELLVLVKQGAIDLKDLHPKKVAVSLVGPQVALDKLDPSSVIPVVDIEKGTEEKNNKLRLPVLILGLPDNIEVGSVIPAHVFAQLPPKPAEETSEKNE